MNLEKINYYTSLNDQSSSKDEQTFLCTLESCGNKKKLIEKIYLDGYKILSVNDIAKQRMLESNTGLGSVWNKFYGTDISVYYNNKGNVEFLKGLNEESIGEFTPKQTKEYGNYFNTLRKVKNNPLWLSLFKENKYELEEYAEFVFSLLGKDFSMGFWIEEPDSYTQGLKKNLYFREITPSGNSIADALNFQSLPFLIRKEECNKSTPIELLISNLNRTFPKRNVESF